MSHAAGHQQRALVLVGRPVAAAHSMLPRKVRAVRRAHTLRPPRLHLANLPSSAFDSFTRVFARLTGDNPKEAQQADLIHGQTGVGPRCVEAAPSAAFLSGHSPHQHHVAPLILTLLQPAHPSFGRIPFNLIKNENCPKNRNQKAHFIVLTGKPLSKKNIV